MSGEDKNKDRHILDDPGRLYPAIICLGILVWQMLENPVSPSPLLNITVHLLAITCAAVVFFGAFWLGAVLLGRINRSTEDTPFTPPMIFIIILGYAAGIATMILILNLASAFLTQETP